MRQFVIIYGEKIEVIQGSLDLSSKGIIKLDDIIGLNEIKELKNLDLSELIGLAALFGDKGKSNIIEEFKIFDSFHSLEFLDLSYNEHLRKLPDNIDELRSLKTLDIRGCKRLSNLPESFSKLENLENFYCDILSNNVNLSKNLRSLTISNFNDIIKYPEVLNRLETLQELRISSDHDMKELPEAIIHLKSLEKLSIMRCTKLQSIPSNLNELKALKKLEIISCNNISVLPEEIGSLNLITLIIRDCGKLKSIPYSIGDLVDLEFLIISVCDRINEIPESIGNLVNLRNLDLHSLDIQTLPKSFENLHSLKYLDLNYCSNLNELPSSIANLPSLKEIVLTRCDALKSIPKSLYNNPNIKIIGYIPPETTYKINDFLSLRLKRDNRTMIYVKDKEFIQCMFLLFINPQIDEHQEMIDSIDEASEVLSNQAEGDQNVLRSLGISPEEEFWGHCSNIQAWAENNYDTRILHRNLAFPLLRELMIAGDPIATKVFKEELGSRISTGYFPVIEYLIHQRYLEYLSKEELSSLFDDPDSPLVRNLKVEFIDNLNLILTLIKKSENLRLVKFFFEDLNRRLDNADNLSDIRYILTDVHQIPEKLLENTEFDLYLKQNFSRILELFVKKFKNLKSLEDLREILETIKQIPSNISSKEEMFSFLYQYDIKIVNILVGTIEYGDKWNYRQVLHIIKEEGMKELIIKIVEEFGLLFKKVLKNKDLSKIISITQGVFIPFSEHFNLELIMKDEKLLELIANTLRDKERFNEDFLIIEFLKEPELDRLRVYFVERLLDEYKKLDILDHVEDKIYLLNNILIKLMGDTELNEFLDESKNEVFDLVLNGILNEKSRIRDIAHNLILDINPIRKSIIEHLTNELDNILETTSIDSILFIFFEIILNSYVSFEPERLLVKFEEKIVQFISQNIIKSTFKQRKEMIRLLNFPVVNNIRAGVIDYLRENWKNAAENYHPILLFIVRDLYRNYKTEELVKFLNLNDSAILPSILFALKDEDERVRKGALRLINYNALEKYRTTAIDYFKSHFKELINQGNLEVISFIIDELFLFFLDNETIVSFFNNKKDEVSDLLNLVTEKLEKPQDEQYIEYYRTNLGNYSLTHVKSLALFLRELCFNAPFVNSDLFFTRAG